MLKKLTLLFVTGVLGLGLTTIATAKKPRTIANGSWGGQHIQLTVSNGEARIEYDCANGSIEGPLKIDSRGRFELRGVHMRGHGGPARIDEQSQREAAKYSGWTDGKKMTLTVTLVNSKTEIGTYQLTRGNTGRIFRCL